MRDRLCLACLLSLALAGCRGNGGEGTETTSPAQTETSPKQPTGAAEGSGPEGTSAVRAAKVEIVDFTYDPDPVTVAAGGKVIWLNSDSQPHTATAEDGSFDTGTLEEGKLKSESFKEPGIYRYTCSIHPQMHGTLEVVD
jgi:plastocyanin